MADVTVENLLGALGLRRSTEPVGAVAVALVVGLAVGGIMGLLFAPKSGDETRDDLRRQAGEVADDVAAAAKKLGRASSDRPSASSP
jgi:gas vesicle protein